MMSDKAVSLERTHTGSFGFSILGGKGMRFPAVICEVDPEGPADHSGKVGGANGRGLKLVYTVYMYMYW